MDRWRGRRRPDLSGRGQERENGKPVGVCRMCALTGGEKALSEGDAYSVFVPEERDEEQLPQTLGTLEDRARYILFLLRSAFSERVSLVFCRKHAEECAEVVATVEPGARVMLWSEIRGECADTRSRRPWRDDDDEDVSLHFQQRDRNLRHWRDATAFKHIALSLIAALDQGEVQAARKKREGYAQARKLARLRIEAERKARETYLERMVKGELEAREVVALDFAKSEPKRMFACTVPDCRTRGNAYARSQKDKPLLWAREVHPRGVEQPVQVTICGWHIFEASKLAKTLKIEEIRSLSLLEAFEHALRIRQMLQKLEAAQGSPAAPAEGAGGTVVSRRSPEWWQKRHGSSQQPRSEDKREGDSAPLTLEPGETVMAAKLRQALGDKTPK